MGQGVIRDDQIEQALAVDEGLCTLSVEDIGRRRSGDDGRPACTQGLEDSRSPVGQVQHAESRTPSATDQHVGPALGMVADGRGERSALAVDETGRTACRRTRQLDESAPPAGRK